MTEDPDAQPEATVEEAKRRGFLKGLNMGLLSVAIPSTAIAVGWSLYDSPRYEAVFRQVKVPMPGLTLLVLNCYPFAAAALVAGVLASIIATCVSKHPKRAVYINAALLIASVFWIALLVTAYHLPFMSVFEGIGQKRSP